MANPHNVEMEAAKFLHKLIQESKDEPTKLATKLYVILQHMRSSGKENSMPYQVISRAMETVIKQHNLDIEGLMSSRLPLPAGSQLGESGSPQVAGSSQRAGVAKDSTGHEVSKPDSYSSGPHVGSSSGVDIYSGCPSNMSGGAGKVHGATPGAATSYAPAETGMLLPMQFANSYDNQGVPAKMLKDGAESFSPVPAQVDLSTSKSIAGKALDHEGGANVFPNANKTVQGAFLSHVPDPTALRNATVRDTGKSPVRAPVSSMPFNEHQLKQLRAQCLVFLAFRNGMVPKKMHLEIALGNFFPKEDGPCRDLVDHREKEQAINDSGGVRDAARAHGLLDNSRSIERHVSGISLSGAHSEASLSKTDNSMGMEEKGGEFHAHSEHADGRRHHLALRRKLGGAIPMQESEPQSSSVKDVQYDSSLRRVPTSIREHNSGSNPQQLLMSNQAPFITGTSKQLRPELSSRNANASHLAAPKASASPPSVIQESQLHRKENDGSNCQSPADSQSILNGRFDGNFPVLQPQEQWRAVSVMDGQTSLVMPMKDSDLQLRTVMPVKGKDMEEEDASLTAARLHSPKYTTSEKWILERQKRKHFTEQAWELKQRKTEQKIAVCSQKLKETVSFSEDISAKTKSVIELKKLQLLELQRRLRSDILNDYHKPIAPDMDRLKSIKKHRIGRRSKQLERYEQRMKEERQKRIRERQKEFFGEVEVHRERLEDIFKMKRERWKGFNKSVREFHKKKERIHREKIDRIQREKINLLKINDVEGYLRMVQDAKSDRVKQLLKETEKYLQKLGSKLQEAKSMERSFETDIDDNRMTNIVEKNEVAFENEDETDQAKHYLESNEKYYMMAHSIKETVQEQPSILKGGKLREYQMNGLRWLVSLYNNHLNGILADEMGLGKTVQVISLICYLMETKNDRGPFLVVVPSSVLPGWESEISFWAPGIHKIVYSGPPDERRRLFKEQIVHQRFNVLLTTYEYLMNKHDRPKLSKVHWHYIIIDEGHRIKNASCKLNADLKHYRSNHRLLLTGTPLQNNLEELWALLNFLLPNIFNSSEDFSQWFNKPFEGSGDNSPDEALLSEEENLLIINRLHQVLRPFVLRRLKHKVENQLPEKIERLVRCEASAYQKLLMKRVEENLGAIGSSKARSVHNSVMELRNICNHPYLSQIHVEEVHDWIPKHYLPNIVRLCGKLEMLDRLLPKLKATDHRVLLFSTMTRLLDVMEDYLCWKQYKYLRLDGHTSGSDRGFLIDNFNRPGSPYFIFLLSIRAGGVGVNLQAADTVIIFDTDWNPQVDLQAQARAHRIGQKKDVLVLRLETVQTVEEQVRASAEHKLGVANQSITAGFFDNNTSAEDRREYLESLLRECKKEEAMPVLDDDSLNDLIARSESEIDIFESIDKRRREEEMAAWMELVTADGNGDSECLPALPSRLLTYDDLKSFYEAMKISETTQPDVAHDGGVKRKSDYLGGLNSQHYGRGKRAREVRSYEEQWTEEEFEKMCQVESPESPHIKEEGTERKLAAVMSSSVILANEPPAPLSQQSLKPSVEPSPGKEATPPSKRGRGRPRRTPINTGISPSPGITSSSSGVEQTNIASTGENFFRSQVVPGTDCLPSPSPGESIARMVQHLGVCIGPSAQAAAVPPLAPISQPITLPPPTPVQGRGRGRRVQSTEVEQTNSVPKMEKLSCSQVVLPGSDCLPSSTAGTVQQVGVGIGRISQSASVPPVAPDSQPTTLPCPSPPVQSRGRDHRMQSTGADQTNVVSKAVNVSCSQVLPAPGESTVGTAPRLGGSIDDTIWSASIPPVAPSQPTTLPRPSTPVQGRGRGRRVQSAGEVPRRRGKRQTTVFPAVTSLHVATSEAGKVELETRGESASSSMIPSNPANSVSNAPLQSSAGKLDPGSQPGQVTNPENSVSRIPLSSNEKTISDPANSVVPVPSSTAVEKSDLGAQISNRSSIPALDSSPGSLVLAGVSVQDRVEMPVTFPDPSPVPQLSSVIPVLESTAYRPPAPRSGRGRGRKAQNAVEAPRRKGKRQNSEPTISEALTDQDLKLAESPSKRGRKNTAKNKQDHDAQRQANPVQIVAAQGNAVLAVGQVSDGKLDDEAKKYGSLIQVEASQCVVDSPLDPIHDKKLESESREQVNSIQLLSAQGNPDSCSDQVSKDKLNDAALKLEKVVQSEASQTVVNLLPVGQIHDEKQDIGSKRTEDTVHAGVFRNIEYPSVMQGNEEQEESSITRNQKDVIQPNQSQSTSNHPLGPTSACKFENEGQRQITSIGRDGLSDMIDPVTEHDKDKASIEAHRPKEPAQFSPSQVMVDSSVSVITESIKTQKQVVDILPDPYSVPAGANVTEDDEGKLENEAHKSTSSAKSDAAQSIAGLSVLHVHQGVDDINGQRTLNFVSYPPQSIEGTSVGKVRDVMQANEDQGENDVLLHTNGSSLTNEGHNTGLEPDPAMTTETSSGTPILEAEDIPAVISGSVTDNVVEHGGDKYVSNSSLEGRGEVGEDNIHLLDAHFDSVSAATPADLSLGGSKNTTENFIGGRVTKDSSLDEGCVSIQPTVPAASVINTELMAAADWPTEQGASNPETKEAAFVEEIPSKSGMTVQEGSRGELCSTLPTILLSSSTINFNLSRADDLPTEQGESQQEMKVAFEEEIASKPKMTVKEGSLGQGADEETKAAAFEKVASKPDLTVKGGSLAAEQSVGDQDMIEAAFEDIASESDLTVKECSLELGSGDQEVNESAVEEDVASKPELTVKEGSLEQGTGHQDMEEKALEEVSPNSEFNFNDNSLEQCAGDQKMEEVTFEAYIALEPELTIKEGSPSDSSSTLVLECGETILSSHVNEPENQSEKENAKPEGKSAEISNVSVRDGHAILLPNVCVAETKVQCVLDSSLPENELTATASVLEKAGEAPLSPTSSNVSVVETKDQSFESKDIHLASDCVPLGSNNDNEICKIQSGEDSLEKVEVKNSIANEVTDASVSLLPEQRSDIESGKDVFQEHEKLKKVSCDGLVSDLLTAENEMCNALAGTDHTGIVEVKNSVVDEVTGLASQLLEQRSESEFVEAEPQDPEKKEVIQSDAPISDLPTGYSVSTATDLCLEKFDNTAKEECQDQVGNLVPITGTCKPEVESSANVSRFVDELELVGEGDKSSSQTSHSPVIFDKANEEKNEVESSEELIAEQEVKTVEAAPNVEVASATFKTSYGDVSSAEIGKPMQGAEFERSVTGPEEMTSSTISVLGKDIAIVLTPTEKCEGDECDKEAAIRQDTQVSNPYVASVPVREFFKSENKIACMEIMADLPQSMKEESHLQKVVMKASLTEVVTAKIAKETTEDLVSELHLDRNVESVAEVSEPQPGVNTGTSAVNIDPETPEDTKIATQLETTLAPPHPLSPTGNLTYYLDDSFREPLGMDIGILESKIDPEHHEDSKLASKLKTTLPPSQTITEKNNLPCSLDSGKGTIVSEAVSLVAAVSEAQLDLGSGTSGDNIDTGHEALKFAADLEIVLTPLQTIAREDGHSSSIDESCKDSEVDGTVSLVADLSEPQPGLGAGFLCSNMDLDHGDGVNTAADSERMLAPPQTLATEEHQPSSLDESCKASKEDKPVTWVAVVGEPQPGLGTGPLDSNMDSEHGKDLKTGAELSDSNMDLDHGENVKMAADSERMVSPSQTLAMEDDLPASLDESCKVSKKDETVTWEPQPSLGTGFSDSNILKHGEDSKMAADSKSMLTPSQTLAMKDDPPYCLDEASVAGSDGPPYCLDEPSVADSESTLSESDTLAMKDDFPCPRDEAS